jgi:hypothetical protein
MFISFDEDELFELFESEPIVASQKEYGQFMYSTYDKRGINITISFSIYENDCAIGLTLEEKLVFECSLENVEYLHAKDSCLRIHQKGGVYDYLIYFKPHIFIIIENI